MENRDLLKTSDKPAPGNLAFVQGLINTIDIESEKDEFIDARALKAWLVRHGLIVPDIMIDEQDRRLAIEFREALRSLVATGSGQKLEEAAWQTLTELAGRCRLEIEFDWDGAAHLRQTVRGIDGALGQLLVAVIEAMISGLWSRLKVCDESRCRWVFFDASKNRSGRWCSMSVCGNRAKARAYRKRKRD